MLQRLILIDPKKNQDGSLEKILQENFDFHRFSSVQEVFEKIREVHPQGIIVASDDRLMEILQELRRTEASRELPLIVVSSSPAPWKEAEALEAGADALIFQDGDPRILRDRILGILQQGFIVQRLKARLDEMDCFVQTVTHDLKNPLNAILSSADLLEQSLEAGDLQDAQELAKVIRRSTEHALDFIRDILGLLRNSTRLGEVSQVPARDVIDLALHELDSKLRESGATVEIPAELPRILCDPRRLAQAFVNILENAIKYVAKGVRPHIAIRWIEAPHTNTLVFVDNGIGMNPKDTKRIFQPFVRLPEAAQYKGTGLGLSIVQRIVEAHDGEVIAVSRKGIGSEFHVVLPTNPSFLPQSVLQSQP